MEFFHAVEPLRVGVLIHVECQAGFVVEVTPASRRALQVNADVRVFRAVFLFQLALHVLTRLAVQRSTSFLSTVIFRSRTCDSSEEVSRSVTRRGGGATSGSAAGAPAANARNAIATILPARNSLHDELQLVCSAASMKTILPLRGRAPNATMTQSVSCSAAREPRLFSPPPLLAGFRPRTSHIRGFPMAKKIVDMAKFAKFCKDMGFIFQSSEIYGGINGFWDYGPLGVELKRNIKEAWWQDMVRNPPPGPDGQEIRMVGLDCSIIMNPKVWVASGHASGFSDPMVDCLKCKRRFRADKVFLCGAVIDGKIQAIVVLRQTTAPMRTRSSASVSRSFGRRRRRNCKRGEGRVVRWISLFRRTGRVPCPA